MTESDIANVLQLCIAIIAGSAFLFGVVPVYRLDVFRDELFCVRNELFDLAADGHIAFDHPAYQLLRQQLNGLIRHGHQLSVFRLLLTSAAHYISGETHEKSWNQAWESSLLEVENDQTRAALVELHEKSLALAVKHLVSLSPTLWTLGMFLGAAALLQGAVLSFGQLRIVLGKNLLHGPLNVRLLEEEVVLSSF